MNSTTDVYRTKYNYTYRFDHNLIYSDHRLAKTLTV
jgi:hypothetical protein